MAGVFGSTSRSGFRPRNAGGGSRDTGLALLASFPDLNRVEADREEPVVSPATDGSAGPKPRIGWGSIAILAVVAFAACTAAWWIDRGPIDPGAAEIANARLAEGGTARLAEGDTASPSPPVRTATKMTKMRKAARR